MCPNPSIDCTLELDSLNVGRLNTIRNKVETYSGKALNVAVGVSRLGRKSLASGFMFDDSKIPFEQALDKEGVSYDFVYGEGSARINYKIIDKRSMLTEINDRGGEIPRALQERLIAKVSDLSTTVDRVVISGSLPKGVDAGFYGELCSVISPQAKIIIDAGRDNVAAALGVRRAYMVKPNLQELEEFSGRSVQKKSDVLTAAESYLKAGADNVLVSMGTAGAVLTDGSEAYYCKSASVAVNSTVGAGDSMIAAFCVAEEDGCDATEKLRRAVAAGTAAVTTSGTNLFYKEKYEEIYDKIKVEKL